MYIPAARGRESAGVFYKSFQCQDCGRTYPVLCSDDCAGSDRQLHCDKDKNRKIFHCCGRQYLRRYAGRYSYSSDENPGICDLRHYGSCCGYVYASRIGFITPTAGNNYEMKAIAACVLGGVALTGGQGSLFGAAIGAIIMSSISRILVFLGFSSDYDNTITGIMLIVIVVVTTVAQNHAIVKNRQ